MTASDPYRLPITTTYGSRSPEWYMYTRAPSQPGLTPQSPVVVGNGKVLPVDRYMPEFQPPPRDFRDVPKPFRVASLPLDRRGYPVFFTITPDQWPADGNVDFRFLNLRAFLACAREHRCGVCGDKLGQRFYFLGGSMCQQNRVFGDPPMHEVCARYALKVCPMLINPVKQYNLRDLDKEAIIDNPYMLTTKPAATVLYRCDGYALAEVDPKPIYIVKPALYVDWFDLDGTFINRTIPDRYVQ